MARDAASRRFERQQSRLRADYGLVCWQGDHWVVVGYALLMAAVYPLGTPALYWRMLRDSRKQIDQITRAELRGLANEITTKQRHASMLQRSLSTYGIDGLAAALARDSLEMARESAEFSRTHSNEQVVATPLRSDPKLEGLKV